MSFVKCRHSHSHSLPCLCDAVQGSDSATAPAPLQPASSTPISDVHAASTPATSQPTGNQALPQGLTPETAPAHAVPSKSDDTPAIPSSKPPTLEQLARSPDQVYTSHSLWNYLVPGIYVPRFSLARQILSCPSICQNKSTTAFESWFHLTL
jgi:hypothetical protein